MFVSIGLRFRAEVEALNMSESVGNYNRHRTAPVLIAELKDGRVSGYRITTAPAVSGQSVAFGFMSALVKTAAAAGLPVCDECRNYEKLGGFFKRADRPEVPHDERVRGCVVEDATGFMAAKRKESGRGKKKEDGKEEEGGESGEGGAVVKRTSPVMFSYMVPDPYSARGIVAPQLHVRYNQLNPDEQRPFQIEAGTAVYVHGVVVDVDRIGRLEGGGYVPDRRKRVEAVFDALKILYGGLQFGAKKARYLPIFEPLGGIAAVSDPAPFVVTPPRLLDYVEENLKRAERYPGSVSLYCFDREGATSCGTAGGVSRAGTLEELIDAVKAAVLSRV